MANKNYFEKMTDEHGLVEFEGKEYALTQDAYLSGYESETWNWATAPHYEAVAVDEEGNEYTVRWEIEVENCEDESMACDWNSPSDVKAI